MKWTVADLKEIDGRCMFFIDLPSYLASLAAFRALNASKGQHRG
jgi:hypothetical protein